MIFERFYRLLQLLLIAMGLTFGSLACSPPSETPASSGKKKDKTKDDDDDDDDDGVKDTCGTSSASSDDDDDDDDADTSDTDDDDADDSTSLRLVEPTWDNDVKSEFQACIACHAEGNEPNTDNPKFDCSDPDDTLHPIAIDLSSIALIKANADEIIKRVEATDDCKMPPSGDGIDLDLFAEWMDNDFAEGVEEEASDDEPTDPCAKTPTAPLEPAEEDPVWLEPFLNPAELDACHDEGKMFDRAKQACSDFTLAETCDETWLGANFPTGWEAINTENKGLGYWLDQCGYDTAEFLATWICFTDTQGGECIDKGDLTEGKAIIKVKNARNDK